ncbi:hypothetical protein KEM54_001512 [Ascosphaera aggregata]|nr:hypothetical protein KEM54_001512 [Ascosphaera aggregata]
MSGLDVTGSPSTGGVRPSSAPVPASTSAAASSAFLRGLDVKKLHSLPSEQQDLYLLTYTADLYQYISSLGKEELQVQQKELCRQLLNFIRISVPPLTRVIRGNIGRCFQSIFTNGNRVPLFDTASELIGLINASNKELAQTTRLAAVSVLGDVFYAAGDGLVSQSSLSIHSLLKLSKNAGQHTGLRASIYVTLRKIITGIRTSIDEQAAKDLWKNARNAAAGDKSSKVQVAACDCLECMIKTVSYFDNNTDYENLKSTLWKVIDTPCNNVRHAAASCLASTLVKAYEAALVAEPVVAAPPKKLSKKLKRQSTIMDEEQPTSRPQSPIGLGRKPEAKLALDLTDALKQLSAQYCKSSTSSRSRAGIAICYKLFLKNIGNKIVESNYAQVASHLFSALMNHPTVTINRYRLLLTRKFCKSILEDTVGHDILHESSQLNAAKWLINSVLKDYPQVVPERPEPSKHMLTGALSALDSLIQSLGSAMSSLAEPCLDALLQVSQHPSYTVQIYAAHCLRSFVLACPQQLLVCVTICMNSLTRELQQLATPRHSTRKCLGYAYTLAATLSTSRLQPLYGSVDIYAQVFNKATHLLKESSTSELRIASTQIQVAFVLIGGLMPLGSSFTKIHLSQLFKIWKNALPLPTPKDVKRGPLELSFLTHVRECALTSIFAFLKFNGNSLTSDGSKHIATMLHNSAVFLEYLPKTKPTDDITQRLMPSVQLRDLVTMVKRRLLQCFAHLITLEHGNQSGVLSLSNVLGLAVSCFADPDMASSKSLDSTIAGMTARFDNLWDMEDNFGFGVTSSAHEFSTHNISGRAGFTLSRSEANSRAQEIDDSLHSPVCQAREHDSVWLYAQSGDESLSMPDPPSTGVVNAAIELFSVSLPLQHPKIQESTIEQIAALLSAHSLNRNPGRKAAMTVNIAVTLLYSLRVAVNQSAAATGGNYKNLAAQKIMQELLSGFIKSADPIVRSIAAEGLGRLCNVAGNSLTNTQMTSLVDTIVENRDPNVRAGCALALGCVHSQVGAMAASLHLKTTIGVLMSLCNDQHPVVHFWALEGLVRVAESAGLTFSAYVSSCLGMLARLYVSDSHNDMSASLATSNLEHTFPTAVVIGRCVDSLINVLGPDLRDLSKARELIFTLVKEFQLEESDELVAISSKCLDHLALYARGQIDFKYYVDWLQKALTSKSSAMRSSAIEGLNNIMESEAELFVQTASPTFEEEIWLALDDAPGTRTIENIIFNWLQQTGLSETRIWVQRFQRVLSMTRIKDDEAAAPAAAQDANEAPDEEVEGFATAIAGSDRRPSIDAHLPTQELLKWQTRNFVMVCLNELLSMVNKEMSPDETVPSEQALQESIGDVIKTAFSASTSNIIELRVWGLKIIDQILKMFGKTPDPDFAEASLLEQYQAQIGSALTPAFAADSSPELATEAINVCSTFVSAGIVTNIDRMGRIFKLLVTGLKDFSKRSDINEIGDFRGLNSNARVMIKLALYSAWARLQIMSNEQAYLVDIVKPYSAMLTPLWLSSLQEYARLRFEPEISTLGTGPFSDDLDDVYAALNRETLLKFYQDSWLYLVDAIASLVEKDSGFVFDALDGKTDASQTDPDSTSLTTANGKDGKRINYRDEPVAFFFILFGLIFEALVDQQAPSSQKTEILQVLQKIWHPAVAGNAIFQDAAFSETMDTLDRLVMTEGVSIQWVIVEIARNLSLQHPSASRGDAASEKLSDDIEQLFELIRTIILVLAGVLPNLGETSISRFSALEETSRLVHFSLSSLIDVVEVFPSIIRSDLRACVLYIFMVLLRNGPCQAEVVPRSLPILRQFLQGMIRRTDFSNQFDLRTSSLQIRGCLKSLLSILEVAQRRESEYSLPCAKNALLAVTIVLSTGHSVIPPQDSIIEQVLDQYIECLEDVGLSNIVAGCLRTLLLGTNSPSPANDVIGRYLLPRLLAFTSSLPFSSHKEPLNDPENSKPIIAKALVSYVTSLASSPEAANAAISLIIPALIKRARNEGESAYEETASHILEIAAAHPTAFRALVARMSTRLSSFLEEIIRSRVEKSNQKKDDTQEQSKPSITLRIDF